MCVNISFWTHSWSFICPLWSNRSPIVEDCVFNQSLALSANHLYANKGSSYCIRIKRTACRSVPQWDWVWPTRELNRATEVCMCAKGSDSGVSNWWPQIENSIDLYTTGQIYFKTVSPLSMSMNKRRFNALVEDQTPETTLNIWNVIWKLDLKK